MSQFSTFCDISGGHVVSGDISRHVAIFDFYRHIPGICRWQRHISPETESRVPYLQGPRKRLMQEGLFQLRQGGELLLVEAFEAFGFGG